MSYKFLQTVIVGFISITTFAASGFDATEFEAIQALSAQDKVSYTAGIRAIKVLPSTTPKELTAESVKDWQSKYNKAHNRLFVLTHIARIEEQIINIQGQAANSAWLDQAKAIKIETKQQQLRLYREALTKISEDSFDHSKHQFNSLDDLGKALSVSLSALHSKGGGFSQGFSKSYSKMGGGNRSWMSENMMMMPNTSQRLFGNYGAFREMLVETFKMSPKDIDEVIRLMDSGDTAAALAYIKAQKAGGGVTPTPTIRVAKLSTELKNTTSIVPTGPLNADAQSFLKLLSVDQWQPTVKKRDLSASYRQPQQQKKSAACVGFAISSDLEFVLNRTGQLDANETVSPWVTYGIFRYREAGVALPSCVEIEGEAGSIASGGWYLHDGIYDIGNSLTQLKKDPLCLISRDEASPQVTNHVTIDGFEEYGRDSEKINFSFLRAMVDNNLPPVLLINSDARRESEDWIKVTRNGQFDHVLVVVGYGLEAINPFTLKAEPYFIVRDSLGSQPIHYHVSAKNLLGASLGLIKITAVRKP